MSQQLVTFEDDNITISCEIFQANNKEKKQVIAIVGQARQGKSTYLNIFGSVLAGKNVTMFPTGGESTDREGCEQITKGIRVYENDKYIYLDCQGLMYENSANDDKILLFAYVLADLIIVHGKEMNNSILHMIQPIALFGNYMLNTKPKGIKPVLIFKICDYSKRNSGDIKGYFDKTFNNQVIDNYTSLKNTLKETFESIDITFTSRLDDFDFDLIDQMDYLEFLKKPDTNFRNSIEFIVSKMPGAQVSLEELLVKSQKVKNDLETNKARINIQEADLCKLLREKEFQKYLDNIRKKYPELSQPIYVDGSNSNFVMNINPMIKLGTFIHNEFNTLFKETDPTIRIIYSKELDFICFNETHKAIKLCKDIVKRVFLCLDISPLVEKNL
jgi:hypothetical protein